MSAPYNLRQHAAEVATGSELARQVLRELAQQRALLERVLAAVTVPAHDRDRQQLDALVRAAFDAIPTSSWAVTELLGRATKADPAGLQLLAAITATGALESNAKSLGRYLADRVKPGNAWTTADGLQLCRSMDSRLVIWSVMRIV
jgi:hypothetical protein